MKTLCLTSVSIWSPGQAISGVNLTINENSSFFPETLAFPLTATNSVVKPSSAAEPLLSDHCISWMSKLGVWVLSQELLTCVIAC